VVEGSSGIAFSFRDVLVMYLIEVLFVCLGCGISLSCDLVEGLAGNVCTAF
jgi:hypothetical protein